MIILGTNSIKDTGYNVANSLRFNDGDSAYLNFTPSSNGSRRIFTISVWFKTSTVAGGNNYIFSSGNYAGGDGFLQIKLSSSGRLTIDDYDQGNDSYNVRWVSPSGGPLIKDPSAWYHLVFAVDSTQGTQSNRAKAYLNGVDISSKFTQTTNPSENDDFHINTSSKVQQIGRSQNDNNYYDGYLAEYVVVDGSQLAPTSFGEFDEDSGIWKPISVSGLTFGTNGFYLEFKESGTSQNSSGLGADTSGNDHHYAVNNLTAIDQSIDTCTNNFCTWNALEYSGDTALAEGNTEGYTRDGVADYHEGARGTIAVSNGKWYWEVKMVEVGDTSNAVFAGIMSADHQFRNGEEDELLLGTYGMRNDGNSVISNGSALAYATYGASFSDGDILNFALDMDNNRLYIGKGGSWADGSGNIDESSINSFLSLSTTPSAYMPMVIGYSTGADVKYQANFGSPPYAISSGNTDAEGFGNFEYAVPSGYFALCTKNLAEYG